MSEMSDSMSYETHPLLQALNRPAPKRFKKNLPVRMKQHYKAVSLSVDNFLKQRAIASPRERRGI